MRHELFNTWLIEKQNVEHILAHLRVANFDPEFFRPYEPQIIDAWNKLNPANQIQLKAKSAFKKLIFGN